MTIIDDHLIVDSSISNYLFIKKKSISNYLQIYTLK